MSNELGLLTRWPNHWVVWPLNQLHLASYIPTSQHLTSAESNPPLVERLGYREGHYGVTGSRGDDDFFVKRIENNSDVSGLPP
jgi:hypothetical protein